jgi:hypothetical protein
MGRLAPAGREVKIPLVEIASGPGMKPYLGVDAAAPGQSLLMQIDTGSSLTLLRESLKKKIKLKQVSRAEIVDLPAGTNQHDVFLTSSLSLGGLVLEDEPVCLVPDSHFDAFSQVAQKHLDGVLGASLFHRGEVEVQPASGTLYIRPFSQSILQKGPYAVQLLYVPDLNGFAVPMEPDKGRPSRFLLDTGSNAEIIFDEESQLGRQIKATPSIGNSRCRTFRETYDVPSYRLPLNLSLAGLRYERGTIVHVAKRRDSRLEGSLGIPLLWSCDRAIFNQHLEQVAFLPKRG